MFVATSVDALATGNLTWRVVSERVEHIGSLDWQKKDHVNSWTEAIAGALFARFDVKTKGSTYALAGHCATETKARLAAAGCSGFDVSTACRDEGLPLPIVVACVAVPDAPQVYFPLEFTPMYSGVCITSLLVIQAECTQCMHAPGGAACRARVAVSLRIPPTQARAKSLALTSLVCHACSCASRSLHAVV